FGIHSSKNLTGSRASDLYWRTNNSKKYSARFSPCPFSEKNFSHLSSFDKCLSSSKQRSGPSLTGPRDSRIHITPLPSSSERSQASNTSCILASPLARLARRKRPFWAYFSFNLKMDILFLGSRCF